MSDRIMTHIDPLGAVELRNDLVAILGRRPDWFLKTTEIMDDTGIVKDKERKDLFLSQVRDYMRNATPMLWDFDLWLAATKGHGAFFESTLRDEHIPDEPILHILVNGQISWHIEDGLPDNYGCQLVLVGPAWLKTSNRLGLMLCTIYLNLTGPGEDEQVIVEDSLLPILRVHTTVGVGDRLGTLHTILTAAHLFTLEPFVDTSLATPGIHDLSPNASRQQRRQHERRKQKLPAVRVVTLRKKEGMDSAGVLGGACAKNWTCQWMVSGHWRKIAGKPSPVYVRAHIKGPSGKPFKHSETVYRVRK